MIPLRLRSESGFTFVAALFMVAIMGVLLGAVGQSVSVIMQREKEKELIFRGLQYRDAIERWNKKSPMPLKELKRLLNDPLNVPNGGLRKLYKDPFTGEDFKVLEDPQSGIYGVVSKSSKEPYKQSNFPEALKSFEGKKKYNEWEFTFKRLPPPVPGMPPMNPANQQPSMPFSEPEGY
jgi:type II secretory pathway pseudopilin PulG